jgi:peptide/nickel transport system substrate-binding protein
VVVGAVAVGLLAAACGGGGGKKSSTAGGADNTTTTAPADVTTSTVAGDTGATSSTTAAGAVSGGTTNTVKSSTATTRKSTTVTTAKKTTPNSQPSLVNVVATPTTAKSGPTPQAGGTITIALASDINGFDPIAMSSSASATDGPRGVAIFDVLFYQDSVSYDVVAQLAQSITSQDGKTWQLKLRPNVKFSDGTTLDAAAVKFNWQRLQDPANNAPTRSTASVMTDMTVVDPLTLNITLSGVNGQFPRVIANAFPFIGSPTALANPKAFNTKPIGAGPFIVKDYVQGDHTTLVRNPGYWNAPMPYLDQINVRVVADETQRANSVMTGEAQAGRTNLPQTVIQAKAAGKAGIVAILNGGNDLIFNCSKAPFNDVRVRKAISEAIDIDAYNQTVEGGAGIPARTLFQDTSALYENIPLSRLDKADAQKLFSAAAADAGGPITFTINASIGKSVTAAEFFQATLNAFKDVKVSVQTVTTPQLVSGAQQGTYQAQIWGNNPIDPEPNLFISFRSGQSANFNRYSNPEMDKALDAGRSSLDPAARKAAYKTVQQLFADEVPSFFYARVQNGFIYDPKLQDMKLFEDGTMLVDRIWLSK